MPIVIPDNLPAFPILKKEGVRVISEQRALKQDIRALEIGLLNLMPNKEDTETQFIRLIASTPLQVNFTLVRMTFHESKNTRKEYLEEFYLTFQEIKPRKFDGFIITGAPIELLEFAQVDYWDEMCEVFDWVVDHVHSTFGICWGGMAMLNYWHKLPKVNFKDKISGCYPMTNYAKTSSYLKGFSDEILVPISRWAGVNQKDIDQTLELKTLLGSPQTGPCLIEDKKYPALYIMNHFEYETETLKNEFARDKKAIPDTVKMPQNYFPDNNPNAQPINRWRSNGHLLYSNWVNRIYQTTEFDLAQIGTDRKNIYPNQSTK
ncbi:MAG: homoserine O-succinyltransferase [Rhodobacteraceae bacterium]|nr:homoserine O-succinyltransferase [Paracoccaceae bacterium]